MNSCICNRLRMEIYKCKYLQMYTRREGCGDANRTPAVGVLRAVWAGCAECVWRGGCAAPTESAASHTRSVARPHGAVHGQRRGAGRSPAPLPATCTYLTINWCLAGYSWLMCTIFFLRYSITWSTSINPSSTIA